MNSLSVFQFFSLAKKWSAKSWRFRAQVIAALAVGSLAPVAAPAQTTPAQADRTLKSIMTSPFFRKAVVALDAGHEDWVADIVRLTEIPAPPFKEAARAKAYFEMFRKRNLSDVEIDEEGNVLGLRKGIGGGRLIIVSAHLDTVFPERTEVKVRREGDKLRAPGVGDDSSGRATQIQYIDALDAARITPRDDI